MGKKYFSVLKKSGSVVSSLYSGFSVIVTGKNEKRQNLNSNKIFFLFLLIILNSFFLIQCKDPVGWVAYGQHIEFSQHPTVIQKSGAVFSIDPASALLTVRGGDIPTGNIHYFCGPRGADHPGTLYCSESEMIAAWNAAGFVKTVSGSNVYPYSPLPAGMAFSGPATPVLEIYAVAHMSYKVDGGKELDPWRVSEPSTIDMSPYLDVTVPNIPAGTTSLKIDLGGVSQNFSGSGLAAGGSQTFRMTGLLSKLGTFLLSVTPFNGDIPTGILSVAHNVTLTMGTNSTSVANLSDIISSNRITILINGNTPPAGFTGNYKLPRDAGKTSFDDSSAAGGILPSVSVSSADIGQSGFFSVTVGGIEYQKYFSVRDLLSENLSSGNYTLNISTLNTPTLRTDSCTINSITLSWDPVAGASFYKLYRDEDFIANVSGTSYTNIGVAMGTGYIYRISAVNASGVEGGLSAETPAKICTINYNLNGGTLSGGGIPMSTYVLSGKSMTVAIPPRVTRDCSEQTVYWNTQANGAGDRYSAGQTTGAINDNTTFYVEWTLLNDAATFNFRLDTSGSINQNIALSWNQIPSSVCEGYDLEYYQFGFGGTLIRSYSCGQAVTSHSEGSLPLGAQLSIRGRWRDHSGKASAWVELECMVF